MLHYKCRHLTGDSEFSHKFFYCFVSEFSMVVMVTMISLVTMETRSKLSYSHGIWLFAQCITTPLICCHFSYKDKASVITHLLAPFPLLIVKGNDTIVTLVKLRLIESQVMYGSVNLHFSSRICSHTCTHTHTPFDSAWVFQVTQTLLSTNQPGKFQHITILVILMLLQVRLWMATRM